MTSQPLRFLTTSLALAALGLVGGCTPSVEKTCEKLSELADKDAKTKSGSGDKPFSLSMSKCVANLTEMKERDPSAYKCAAKVVAKLDSIDTALMAIGLCDHDKPKKKASSDDDDDKSSGSSKGSKSKGDDDDKPASSNIGACVGSTTADNPAPKGMPDHFCLERQKKSECLAPGSKLKWTFEGDSSCKEQGYPKQCTGKFPKSARFAKCPAGETEL